MELQQIRNLVRRFDATLFGVEFDFLFNPHIDYKELLKISHIEVKRT